MIKNKKLMMALSFTLGAALLVTTAFADIMSTSGYDQLKQAIKYTSKSCSNTLESFTLQTSITIKTNEKVLFTSVQTEKYDNVSGASESKSIQTYSNGNTDKYKSYSDKYCHISYNPWNDTYSVFEYGKENEGAPSFKDIFEDDEMKDIEKIIDAGVGNLKDYVIVENQIDGSKEFSGSLDNAQIPALVNAILSFIFKRTIPDVGMRTYDDFPEIQNDVFIKKITGKASVNKDGILERIYGSSIVSGKDEAGKSYDFTIEVLIKIYDINSTVVTKPDLNGKIIEKSYANRLFDKVSAQKYIGKYKQDIVIVKDNAFIKIGERVLEIDNIDDENVSGKYYETYKAEYVEYAKDKLEFDFEAKILGYNYAQYKLTSDQGNSKTVTINFEDNSSMINFNIYSQYNYNSIIYKTNSIITYSDGIFMRVFED
ncbi:hypothetical protein [Acetivibrio clariflavus]|uniref:hypothetical protein n=1 Tax=Acetivibrio clariflavus TaxID=288965 RepID=UPI000488BDDA|nr:hypothetical protein [Acetivibrio clariflavus]